MAAVASYLNNILLFDIATVVAAILAVTSDLTSAAFVTASSVIIISHWFSPMFDLF